MKNKMLLSFIIAALPIVAQAAQDPIPNIIFVPKNAEIVEAEQKRFGGFELEANVSNDTLSNLSDEVKNFYNEQGFSLHREQADHDDVELKFIKEQESIEVDIELEHSGIIEYSVDYETK